MFLIDLSIDRSIDWLIDWQEHAESSRQAPAVQPQRAAGGRHAAARRAPAQVQDNYFTHSARQVQDHGSAGFPQQVLDLSVSNPSIDIHRQVQAVQQ